MIPEHNTALLQTTVLSDVVKRNPDCLAPMKTLSLEAAPVLGWQHTLQQRSLGSLPTPEDNERSATLR